jgi:hypothetical protein
MSIENLGQTLGLCGFSDSLGKPAKGFHRHVMGVAVADLVGTVIVLWGLATWQRWPMWQTQAIGLSMTILIHKLFCVRTSFVRAFDALGLPL